MPVDLAPKAFEALKILIGARPRAVSQRELYDALWPDTTVEIANLYNVIHALRAALGDASKTIIRTVYDYGFAFAPEIVVAGHDPCPRSGRFELELGSRTIPLGKGVHVIGRDAELVVSATVPSVSRRHARIVVTETAATIEDLGSTNGTVVAGQPITGAVRLYNGDLIVFGDTLSAIFRAVPAAAPTERALTKQEVR
ncbi:MAG TPA: FHA domain-containing protein [Thermoanaerobaculia bacterium]